jgi:hypothetical protein
MRSKREKALRAVGEVELGRKFRSKRRMSQLRAGRLPVRTREKAPMRKAPKRTQAASAPMVRSQRGERSS